MVITAPKLAEIREEVLEEDTKGIIASLKLMGLKKEEAYALLDKYWD